MHRIWGLTIHYEGNAIRRIPTVLRNLRGAVSGWPRNVRAYFRLLASFRPDVVISDFESFSYLFGKAHRIPVIDLDNIHVISRCRHSPELLRGHEQRLRSHPERGHGQAAPLLPLPRSRPSSTRRSGSGARRSSRRCCVPRCSPRAASAGEHLLVYQTATTNLALPEALKRLGVPCAGLRPASRPDGGPGGGQHHLPALQRGGFIDDLRTARAVVAGGGFTLLGEAVYLHKPVLSVPVERQFEQVLNALYIQALGYGAYARRLDEDVLGAFLARVPEHERALAGYAQDGNAVALATVNEQLDRVAARRKRRRQPRRAVTSPVPAERQSSDRAS